MSICVPLLTLTNLNLRGVAATDAKRDYLFGHYLALRLLTTAVGVLAIAAIGVVGLEPVMLSVLMAMGLAKGVETISDIHQGLFQRQERMNFIAISIMLRSLASLVVISLALWLTGSLAVGLVGSA